MVEEASAERVTCNTLRPQVRTVNRGNWSNTGDTVSCADAVKSFETSRNRSCSTSVSHHGCLRGAAFCASRDQHPPPPGLLRRDRAGDGISALSDRRAGDPAGILLGARASRRVAKPFWLYLTLLSFAPLAACSPPAEPTQAQITIVQPGIEAEQRGDYGFALFTYRYWAHLNVALAQYRLGRLYEQGLGTRQDDAEAAKWYRAASETGYQPAHTALARLYEQGRGVPQDHALTLALYQKAAAAGDPEAHHQAGRLLDLGRGTAVDPRAAGAHYQGAATVGSVEAQVALAQLAPADPRPPERFAPHGAGQQPTAADGPQGAYVLAPMPPEDDRMAPEAKGAVELVGVRDEIQERLLKFNLPVEEVTGSSLSEHEPVGGPAAAVALSAGGAGGRRPSGVQACPSLRAGQRRAARSGRGADLVRDRAAPGLRGRESPRRGLTRRAAKRGGAGSEQPDR
jgi:TPR repeat protein